MTITSGPRSRDAGAARRPSPTEPTTSNSSWIPRSSSRAERKTSLSSTSRIRIGPPTGGSLLGGEEERVVRLAALEHVELDLRVALSDPPEQPVEARGIGAEQQRQRLAPAREEPLDDDLGHLV